MRYFAASVDSPDTNKRFAQSLGIDYPLLSDPTKATARAYGVLGPTGLASRWTFYIGIDGRVLDVNRKVTGASHGHDVVARLSELDIPRT